MALILPNTIANLTPADGAKVQQNFASVQSWANQEAIARDGSTAMTAPLLLPGAPTQPNQAATKAYVDSSVPVGVIQMYVGDAEPGGWLFCRAQALSRATYAALFAVIGTKYGAGDGSTTFNLPSLQGRAPMGYWPGGTWAQTMGGMVGAADSTLPSHTHNGADHLHGFSGTTAGANARHDHQEPSISVYQNTASPQFYIALAGSGPLPGAHFDLSQLATGTDRQDHGHAFSGATGAADRGLTTSAAGASATNTNISPSTVVNFIIRVS